MFQRSISPARTRRSDEAHLVAPRASAANMGAAGAAASEDVAQWLEEATGLGAQPIEELMPILRTLSITERSDVAALRHVIPHPRDFADSDTRLRARCGSDAPREELLRPLLEALVQEGDGADGALPQRPPRNAAIARERNGADPRAPARPGGSRVTPPWSDGSAPRTRLNPPLTIRVLWFFCTVFTLASILTYDKWHATLASCTDGFTGGRLALPPFSALQLLSDRLWEDESLASIICVALSLWWGLLQLAALRRGEYILAFLLLGVAFSGLALESFADALDRMVAGGGGSRPGGGVVSRPGGGGVSRLVICTPTSPLYA